MEFSGPEGLHNDCQVSVTVNFQGHHSGITVEDSEADSEDASDSHSESVSLLLGSLMSQTESDGHSDSDASLPLSLLADA